MNGPFIPTPDGGARKAGAREHGWRVSRVDSLTLKDMQFFETPQGREFMNGMFRVPAPLTSDPVPAYIKRAPTHCSGCLQGCDLCDTEAANDIPHHAQTTFRPRQKKAREYRPMSHWLVILLALLVLAGWLLGSIYYVITGGRFS